MLKTREVSLAEVSVLSLANCKVSFPSGLLTVRVLVRVMFAPMTIVASDVLVLAAAMAVVRSASVVTGVSANDVAADCHPPQRIPERW
jgi:hypothetical protein